MRTLIDRFTVLSIRFKWITIALAVIAMVGGVYSATQLNQELIPDIEFPQTFILALNGGASSDQVLTLYNRPMEEHAENISDVVNVETTSSDGFGFAILRNEFGADQEAVTEAIRLELESIPLPTRTLTPPEGMNSRDLLRELSPEAVLWLYNWARVENSPFVSVLSDAVWESLSPEAIGILPEDAFAELSPRQREDILEHAADYEYAGEPVFDPESVPPPALPPSWQSDPRFATAQDLVEMTASRSIGQVLNDLVEDGELVGPLGTVSDLTPADVQIFLATEAACREFLAANEAGLEADEDACSYIGQLDSAAILALPDDILAALPADFLAQISQSDRNAIAQVRVAEALSGQELEQADVELPDAWRVEAPQLLTFSFTDLPIGVISVRSDTLSFEDLLAFVNNDLVPNLEELELVANVTVEGGEIIPAPILNAALAEEGLAPVQSNGVEPTQEPEATAEPAATKTPVPTTSDAPALPGAWSAMAGYLQVEEMNSADDLLALVGGEVQGQPIESVAGFMNMLAGIPQAAALLADLDSTVFNYLSEQEPDFYTDLSPEFATALATENPDLYAEIAEQLPQAAASISATATCEREFETGPELSEAWAAVGQFIGVAELNSADDLALAQCGNLSAFMNTLIASPEAQTLAAPLFGSLLADVWNYWAEVEEDFFANLAPEVVSLLPYPVLLELDNNDLTERYNPTLGEAWTQLSALPIMADHPLRTVNDLEAAGAVETLSTVLGITGEGLNSYAIQLMDTLNPTALETLVAHNPDLLNELSEAHPETLTYLSRPALQTQAITEFLETSKNAELVEQLNAIREGAPTAAESLIGDQPVFEPDPNAPVLPSSWAGVAGFLGIAELDTADDALHVPSYSGAADMLNQFAVNPQGQGLVRDVPLEVWLYWGEKEPNFWNNVSASALRLLDQEQVSVDQLPAGVQDRILSGGESYTPERSVTRADGSPSLLLNIFKTDTANTVEAWSGVDEVLHSYSDNENVQINEVSEQASFITESLQGVLREGLLGSIMAILMILLFMHLSIRSTLVTAVSIPTSVALALIFIKYVPANVHEFLEPIVRDTGDNTLGSILNVILRLFPESYTLNIMTLSGFTVAIGRVVDDSIVVLENIYRNIHLGQDKRAAIRQGTYEVSVAILAATLTTMVVFIPLGLFGGIIGSFFLPFGLAVTYALAASYIVAVTLVPALADIFINPEKALHEEEFVTISSSMNPLQQVWAQGKNLSLRAVEWMNHNYGLAIQWALNHRLIVIAAAVVSLIFGMILLGNRPVQFLPSFGEPALAVTVDLPAEFEGQPITIAQTDAKVRRLESWLLDYEGVESIEVTLGSSGNDFDVDTGAVDETVAGIQVSFASESELESALPDIRAEAERIFNDVNNDGVVDVNQELSQTYVTVAEGGFGGGFGGLAVELRGTDKENPPSLTELAKYNETILRTLNSIEGLVNVQLESSLPSGGSSAIYTRIDGVPALRYSALIEAEDTIGITTQAILDVQAAVDQVREEQPDLESPVEVSQGFDSEIQSQGIADIVVSMGIATIIIYLLLVVTFGHLLTPFEILISLPLSIVGAAVALAVTDRALGLSAMIGMLMLIGIVVTNAIVLLDRVKQNVREKQMNTHDSLVEAGKTRLRPILMTAFATMIALLPLAASQESGAIIAAELGTVVIGGLLSSTILTLLVVPVVHSLVADAMDWVSARLGLRSSRKV